MPCEYQELRLTEREENTAIGNLVRERRDLLKASVEAFNSLHEISKALLAFGQAITQGEFSAEIHEEDDSISFRLTGALRNFPLSAFDVRRAAELQARQFQITKRLQEVESGLKTFGAL